MIRAAAEPRPRPKLVTRDAPEDAPTSDSSAARLRSYVERVERLQEEIDGLNADKSEVFSQAKGDGFDVKVMKHVIRLRRMESADRRELEELIDLYQRALGMIV